MLSWAKLRLVAPTAEAEGQAFQCNQEAQWKRKHKFAVTNDTAMMQKWYLHGALVGLRNLAHSKGGVLCTLPKQVLAPKLWAAAMICQHHLPPPLQLIRGGHGLSLCSCERHLTSGIVSCLYSGFRLYN